MPLALSRLTFATVLLSAAPILAQTKAPAVKLPAVTPTVKTPAATPGGFTYSAANVIYRSNGVRLEGGPNGLASVKSPQLNVTAQVIAFDLTGSTISEVRAQANVNLNLNMVPQGGGVPAHIEATCNNAVLTPGTRKLVLTGNLKGFYQVQGGAKNTLSGESATLTYAANNLLADLSGGAAGVSLSIPAESLGRPDGLGDVLITAQNAHINQSDGSATFTGNARAVSKGGTNNFDVAAPEFILTRSTDGTISTLKCNGRTVAKLDLPPDPVPAPAKVVPAAEPAKVAPVAPTAIPAPVAPATETKAKPSMASLGQPTHVEVTADGAVIERATSTATFDGNVKGFYRLSPPTGAPQNYNFVGNKAVIRYNVPGATNPTGNALAGLNVEVTGVPVSIEGPAFNLGF